MTSQKPKRLAAPRPGKPSTQPQPAFGQIPQNLQEAYEQSTYFEQMMIAIEMAREYWPDRRFRLSIRDDKMLNSLRSEDSRLERLFGEMLRAQSPQPAKPWWKGSLRDRARASILARLKYDFADFLEDADWEDISFLREVMMDTNTGRGLFHSLALNLRGVDDELEERVELLAARLGGRPLSHEKHPKPAQAAA